MSRRDNDELERFFSDPNPSPAIQAMRGLSYFGCGAGILIAVLVLVLLVAVVCAA